MGFEIMPKKLILKLLDGHEDTMSEALAKKLDSIKNLDCPECGATMVPEADFENPFGNESHIPRYLAACPQCGCATEPETGMVIRLPRKADLEL